MDPISIATLALGAGKLLGGVLGIGGQKERPSIDPEFLKRTFGADAVNQELMQLFNQVMNSAQGQQLMSGAAQQGQQFQTDTARAAAAAGLGPSGGATSGTNILAGSSAGGAVSSLQRGVQSQLMQSMLPVASQMVQDQLAAYMQGQGLQAYSPYMPSKTSDFGNFLSQISSAGLAAMPSGGGGISDYLNSAATPGSPPNETIPAPPQNAPYTIGGTLPVPPLQGMGQSMKIGATGTTPTMAPGVSPASKLSTPTGVVPSSFKKAMPAPPMIPPPSSAMTPPRALQDMNPGRFGPSFSPKVNRFQNGPSGAVRPLSPMMR